MRNFLRRTVHAMQWFSKFVAWKTLIILGGATRDCFMQQSCIACAWKNRIVAPRIRIRIRIIYFSDIKHTTCYKHKTLYIAISIFLFKWKVCCNRTGDIQEKNSFCRGHQNHISSKLREINSEVHAPTSIFTTTTTINNNNKK